MAELQVRRKGTKITLGDATIQVCCSSRTKRLNLAETLERMIQNKIGSTFCPVCGSSSVHWRHGGPEFENEKRCSSCDHCWEP